MLDSLFIGQTVGAVSAVLDGADTDGAVVVIGQPRVGRALADRGRRVVLLAAKPKLLRRVEGTRVYAATGALPLADECVAALVTFGVGQSSNWSRLMSEWSRVVVRGGLLVMVDRTPAAEISRRALCGGLAEIQQRDAGRSVVTSGVVVKL